MNSSKEPANLPTIYCSLCGHKDSVTSVDFHPYPEALVQTKRKHTSSTRQVATSSLDGTLNIWNYSNDRKDVRVFRFHGHEGPCHSVRYSPSGSLIASCSSDKTVRVWLPKASTNSESVILRGHSAAVKDVDFSSGQGYGQSLLLSCSDDKTLRIWDLSQNSFKSCLVGHNNWINSCRFMPNSLQLAASGSDDGTIRLWDVTQSANLVTYNVNMATSATGSLSRRHGGPDARIGETSYSVKKIDFHPSGSLMGAYLSNGSVEIYDLRSDHLIHTYLPNDKKTPKSIGGSLAFHQHGNHLMIGSNDGESFSLWDLRSTKTHLFRITSNINGKKTNLSSSSKRGHQTNSCCSFSADGSDFVAANSNSKEAFAWTSFNNIAQSYYKQEQEDQDECTNNDYVEIKVDTVCATKEGSDSCTFSNEATIMQEECKTDDASDVSAQGTKEKYQEQHEDQPICEDRKSDATNSNNELGEILMQMSVLTQTIILLEKRLSIQEEMIRSLRADKETRKAE